MVITDHSQSLKVANGLQVERLLRQNEKLKIESEYQEIDILFRHRNGYFARWFTGL